MKTVSFRHATLLIGVIACQTCSLAEGAEFVGAWPAEAERVWLGPEYWANRLQDWQVANGRIECRSGGPDRNVHILTRQIGRGEGDLQLSIRLGTLKDESQQGWAGWRIGARGRFDDYRESAIYGKGIDAGVTIRGELFIGKPPATAPADAKPGAGKPVPLNDVELRLIARPAGDAYRVTLEARDPKSGEVHGQIDQNLPAADLPGNIALVCHSEQHPPRDFRAWFSNLRIAGTKIEAHDKQAFGPILFAQHTLSRGTLKMTAQMAPVGPKDPQAVRLETRTADGDWKNVAQAPIDPLARTTTFRIEKWDASRDVPYRVAYSPAGSDGRLRQYHWGGTIRRDPLDKKTIVVATFTGNNDLGFPNNDVVRHVRTHDPDVLVFTGDQIYERVAGYGNQRRPLDMACLDYLRKWYLVGWSFGELLRDRPCVCLPDDHDVYHGNLWGAGGRAAKGEGMAGQDSGGYTMPAEFVKMVERTQTSHLADPYDPTPIEQGIGVYYGPMNYGGVSFAVIEDRKFKSPPAVLIPEGKVVNGWFQNPDFDPARQADVPGAELLGERQMKFLRDWATDWSGGAWMKVVLSQTLFANVATLPKVATADTVVSKLRIPAPGEYIEGDKRVADADSNGWPQTGRNLAIREMRRCFAFHLCGDQHLGSTVRYGVDEWRDAGYALCVPSIANFFPRRWFPPEAGLNRRLDAPRYTGDFLDGFGNHVTVYAVSNPMISGREPADLHDRSPGYGIARFNRKDRSIVVECWPRYADPANPASGGQYSGWPITIHQMDNYGRKAAAYLPTIEVEGMDGPVVQVFSDADSEMIYSLRIQGSRFRPKVFAPGTYTVVVGEPGTPKSRKLEKLAAAPDNEKTVRVGL